MKTIQAQGKDDQEGQFLVLPEGVQLFSTSLKKSDYWLFPHQDGAMTLLPRKARQSRRSAKKLWKRLG